MDKKKIILLGGLGVIAVVAFLQLQKLSAPPPAAAVSAAPVAQVISNVEYVEVLATTRDISQGTRLTPDMLQWRKWPVEALEENLVDIESQPQALEEYTNAVTIAKIYEGEPLIRQKVVQAGERGLMAAQLKPGMRAISTRITADTAAGGFIQPGDRVDVVLTTQLPQGLQATAVVQNNFVANTIFENVPVLAIGQTSSQNPDGTAFVIGSTALLEMSQADAEVLTEAQSRGDISLILRGLNRRNAGFVASTATSERKKNSTGLSSLTIYRNGQKQQVSIQGR